LPLPQKKDFSMKKLAFGLCGALAFGILAGPASAALPGKFVQLPQRGQPVTVIGHPEMTARYAVVPVKNLDYAKMMDASAKSLSIPFWSSSFTYNGKAYPFTMVGTDPTSKPKKSTIKTVVYAYKLTFSDGSVYDPTAVVSSCDSVSPYQRLMDSPLYNASDIQNSGVDLGNVQYENAEQLGEFYTYLSADLTKYAVNLKNDGKPQVISLTVPSNVGHTTAIKGFCQNGKIGEVDINWLANQISTTSWSTKTVAVVLLTNVFQTESGSCCVLGYHGGYTASNGALQTYSVTAMSNSGIFSAAGIQDIHATSHEFGELINDPSGGNATPLWGHIGQVSGCQGNLEVGDPLTGTVFGAPGGGNGITLGSYTYHPQELVYYSWFSRDSPSLGAAGKYSMSGTFTKAQGVC
jgi:hypothetical protein